MSMPLHSSLAAATQRLASTALLVVPAALLAAPSAALAAPNVTGKVDFDLFLGYGGAKELMIREPEMCEGDARAKVQWNKNQDRVRIKLELEGIPYEPSYCFEFDPSTEYNEYPFCVEEGEWQLWFVTRFFTRTSLWYYDSVSGDLIGNEHDLLDGPPPGAIPIELPVVRMMCGDTFQPNPANLRFNGHFDFAYEQMLDGMGTPGAIAGVLPFNLFDADSYYVYYTTEILPMDEAESWDDTLADLAAGSGFAIATSVEPDVKPPSLMTHDQVMIGWGASYPVGFINPLPPEVFDDPDCGTEQVDVPFPGGELPS